MASSQPTAAPDDRPHKCDWLECTAAFKRQGDLKRHNLSHSQERPYKCSWEGCNKAFGQKGGLEVHKTVHIKKMATQCILCEKRLSASSSLSRHKKRQHADFIGYKCCKCNFLCKSDHKFLAHLTKHCINWWSIPYDLQQAMIVREKFVEHRRVDGLVWIHSDPQSYS